jgi:homoserine kinase type II
MTDNLSDICTCIKSHYGIDVSHIEPIAEGLTNTNFRVCSGDDTFIFKIYNFKSKEEVEDEVRVLSLLEKHDFPSPRLFSSTEEIIGTSDTKPCILYRLISGDTNTNWGLDILRQAGGLMGRQHVLLCDVDTPHRKFTRDYDRFKEDVYSRGHRFTECGYEGSDTLLSFVKAELDELEFPPNLPHGYTHQDIKPENVTVQEGKIAGIIDFDVSYYGVLLNDITTTIVWSCFKYGVLDEDLMNALIEGYEEKRNLTKAEREFFPKAIRYRLVREAFYSPFDVLPNHVSKTKKRSEEFIELTNNFKALESDLRPRFQ